MGNGQHSGALDFDLPLGVEVGADGIDDAAVDNLDGGDDGNGNTTLYNHMKRHAHEQIKQLEGVFERCTHPGGGQRVELAKKLGLEERQVKFWFQNRRTQKKVHDERQERMVLLEEKKKLLAENKVLKKAIQDKLCFTCNSPVVPAKESLQHLYLRFQNTRLADELQHATALLNKVVQDADAQEPGLPLMFPLAVAMAIPHHGSLLVYCQTSLVIDHPTPLQVENPICPEPTNSTRD